MPPCARRQADTVCIVEAYAQRFSGLHPPAGKRLEIHGTPGKHLACYMDGGEVEVFGSAWHQTANTMNAGTVGARARGRCGRVTPCAAASLHRARRLRLARRHQHEAVRRKCPVIVIGGDAGNFLGEYMAGGIIVLMGRAGDHLASGMHGGVIYLRRNNAPAVVPDGLDVGGLTDDDAATLGALLARYDACFGTEPHEQASVGEFVALRPASSRPYAAMYAS